jgi:cell division protein FtsX
MKPSMNINDPVSGPYTDTHITWAYVVSVIIVSLVAYGLIIFYLHVKSAAAQAMREVARQEQIEKRIQQICGENARVSPVGNGTWTCQDKRGKGSVIIKE